MYDVPRQDLTEFLQALIRIPSVNPPGNEEAVAELIAAKLRTLNCDVTIVDSEPGRPNVVAHWAGSGQGNTLLLNGHMDVQPAGRNWIHDPFGGEIEQTRLYGRGSLDMKAGLAAMIYAVETLQRTRVRLAGDLVLAIVADEVSGGHKGTGYLVRQGLLHADMAVVCEPTGEKVNVAHRGCVWMEIEIHGRSAHGGRPWLGVNAISKMGRVIRAIEDELTPSFRERTHPLLPSPTINLGTIEGGTKFNLVADHCLLQLDRRLIPGELAAAAVKEIEDVCATVLAADTEQFRYEVREVMHVDPAEISPEAPIVRECRRAFRDVTGQEAGIGCTAGFEDAHFLLKAGIPTAMFGPYHRERESNAPFFTTSGMADEFVDLPEVFVGTEIYARLIQNLLS